MSDLKLAIKIIRQSNIRLAKKFKTLGNGSVHLKKNQEIVTAADIEINKFITGELLSSFPNDDIVSEEAQKINNPGKNIWYIDPLDGTTNFSYGFREFAVCLAKITPQDTRLGVVGIPLSKEIYWAKKEGGAYLNGKKIQVSSALTHGKKIMILLCGGHKHASQQKFLDIITNLNIDKFRFRVLSSAGVELTSVACGRADACILSDVLPWDVLAGVLIVRAAGGKVTNFGGKEWTIKDTTLIASNGQVHSKILHLVK